ncbi:MAG: hypothetical protein KC636_37015 [Myxococcales bacterium]|nr:hypothetical protein [Myxococcales bacterium]
MQDNNAIYAEAKRFVDFTDDDAANLVKLAPLFAERGAALTDAFYEKLLSVPETAAIIEGRVDALKQTHARWMAGLFSGDYGEEYFQSRFRIGLVHAKVGVLPRFCECVISVLRTGAHRIMAETIGDCAELSRSYQSVVRVLDLDLMIINLAYEGERLDRLSKFTGMSRKLLERCISRST